MRRFAFVLIAVFSLSLAGCKPDAAIKRGAVVGAGPDTTEKDVKKPGAPIIIEPKVEKDAPVKQVQ